MCLFLSRTHSSLQTCGPCKERAPMDLNLALFIKSPIAFLDDLVKLFSENPPLFSLTDRIPAKRVHPVPESLWGQPHRPLDLLSLDGCCEERRPCLSLALEYFLPEQVPEAGFFVCLFVEVEFAQLVLPLSGWGPALGAVVLRFLSVLGTNPAARCILQSSAFQIRPSLVPGLRTR